MSKLNILKKAFAVIIKTMSDSGGVINNNIGQNNNDLNEIAAAKDETSAEKAIKELCRNFAKDLNNRDFEYLDGRAEYHHYTVNHLIELVKNDDEQSTLNMIKENRIKSKYEDCEFVSMIFNENQAQAEVVYNVIISVNSADDKYFKELNKKNNKKNMISSGTPFSSAYTLTVIKEKGTWKVDKFEASDKYIKIIKNS